MKNIVVGTRGSSLGLKQTDLFREALNKTFPELAVEVKIIKTKGDSIKESPVSKVGSKTLFTKELEDALLAGDIDAAVHSGKDLAADLPAGLAIGAVLPRADRGDAFCSVRYSSLETLPEGACVGTGSLRRRAQILHRRPDLKIADIRGNVDTRIRKLSSGDYDALILAVSGLERLGLSSHIKEKFDTHVFLPAPVQGALAVEYRSDRRDAKAVLEAVSDKKSFLEVKAERALLERLEAGCNIPLGACAEVVNGHLAMTAGLFSPDGTESVVEFLEGNLDEPDELGWRLAKRLLQSGGQEILDLLRDSAR